MANAYAGVFPTLIAAFDDASKALDAPNILLQSGYRDMKPTVASLYDTISLNIPASSGTVSNVGSGSLTFQDVAATPVSLQLNQHPAYGFKLPDYDRMRSASPQDLRTMFVDEAIKKIGVYGNQAVAALITSGNFAQVVAGGSADTITVAECTSMWGILAAAKVPVRDFGNFFLLTHPVVYSSLLGTSTWTADSNVGYVIAGETRRTAMLGQQFGAFLDYDLDMPVATGVYTSAMFHRNAFAFAARALEVPQAGGVIGMIVDYKGLPIRVTIDWNQTALAYTITFDALFGVTVFRANHLVRHTST